MTTRNTTLSLPERVLRETKAVAARQGTSVSALVAGALAELVERESGYAAARERSLAMMQRGVPFGIGDRIAWSRDDLHQRQDGARGQEIGRGPGHEAR